MALRCHITQNRLLLREEPGGRLISSAEVVWDTRQNPQGSLCWGSAACTSLCPWPGAGHGLCQRCACKSWSNATTSHPSGLHRPAPPTAPGRLSFLPSSRGCRSLGRHSSGCRNALNSNRTTISQRSEQQAGQEADLAVCNTVTQSSHTGAPETVGRSWAAMEKLGFTGCDGTRQSAQLSLLLSLPQTTTELKAKEPKCQFPPRRYLSTNSHLLS